MNKKVIIAAAILVAALVLGWLLYISTRPLPGQNITHDCDNYTDFSKLAGTNTSERCRVHVPIGTEVNYQTNPPVFGPHYEEWTRAGVYSEIKDDRNLVHSLEHGYVIMHYKCEGESGKGKDGEATESAEATASGGVDKKECEGRKVKLEEIYNKKGKRKLIVVPRPNLDNNFAITAWGYLDKFDSFDQTRIDKFIDAHRDNGPEKTME